MQVDISNLADITNEPFFPLYTNKDRYLILWGGGDSGKSHFMATKCIFWCLWAAHHGYTENIYVWRKTKPSVRVSAFKLLKEKLRLFGVYGYAKITKTPMQITLFGSTITCDSIDDPDKIKSIEGVTKEWFEEPTELNVKDFRQGDLRLRGQTPSYKQIGCSFNPVDINSWIKKEFFDLTDEDGNPREDVIDVTPADWPPYMQRRKIKQTVKGVDYAVFVTLMHSTYHSNRFAEKEDIAILEGLKYKDRNYYDVYCLGKWGVLKGLIYENYEIVTEWPDKDTDGKVLFDCEAIGLDFGYTNNPTAIIHIGFIGNDLYMREYCYETKLTNPNIANRLDSLLEEIDRKPTTVADSAEPKSIAEIKEEGVYIVPCEKGKDSIVHGIQRVKQYELKIYHESTNLIKELQLYKWEEKKDGEPGENPVDYMNHLLDAGRYAVVNLKGKLKAVVEFLGASEKDERTEKLLSEDYNAYEDEVLWQEM